MKQYGTWDEKKDLKEGKMKSNKLIAEFMGYKLMSCSRGKAWDIGKSIPTKDHLLPIQGMLHTGNELKFHKSWDWLMPVIEKIETLGYSFEKNYQPIEEDWQSLIVKGEDILYQEFDPESIKASYYAVCKLITDIIKT